GGDAGAAFEYQVEGVDAAHAADERRLVLVFVPAAGGAGGEGAHELAGRGVETDLDLLAFPPCQHADARGELGDRGLGEVDGTVAGPVAALQVADDRLPDLHARLRDQLLGLEPRARVLALRLGRRLRRGLRRRAHRAGDAGAGGPGGLAVLVGADVRLVAQVAGRSVAELHPRVDRA